MDYRITEEGRKIRNYKNIMQKVLMMVISITKNNNINKNKHKYMLILVTISPIYFIICLLYVVLVLGDVCYPTD